MGDIMPKNPHTPSPSFLPRNLDSSEVHERVPSPPPRSTRKKKSKFKTRAPLGFQVGDGKLKWSARESLLYTKSKTPPLWCTCQPSPIKTYLQTNPLLCICNIETPKQTAFVKKDRRWIPKIGVMVIAGSGAKSHHHPSSALRLPGSPSSPQASATAIQQPWWPLSHPFLHPFQPLSTG